MAVKFTAGEFAKLHGISKQTLLFYDKIGLLRPAEIDESNRYRYYDSKQLEVLDTIFILKEIGVPLKEIKQFLEDRTASHAIDLLSQQKMKLDRMIEDHIKIRQRLINKLDTLNTAKNLVLDGSVKYHDCEEQYLYCEKVCCPNSPLDTDIAIKRLINGLTEKRYSYNYQIGVIISSDSIEKKDYLSASYVFAVLDKNIQDDSVIIKPKGIYADYYHKGAYRNEDESYKMLVEAIKKDGFAIKGSSYEECLIDNLSSIHESGYITKISIRVTMMNY